MSREILSDIIQDFSTDKFIRFFREKNVKFAPKQENIARYNDENFKDGEKLGEIKFAPAEHLAVFAFQASQPISERSGKKSQYEKGRKILKERQYDAGIFIFRDKKGNFRFSLIYPQYQGKKRTWNNFRRFTYFVSEDPQITNKTFLKQIGEGDFSSLEKIKEAFSITAVTNIFYNEFFKIYNKIVEKVNKINKIQNEEKARDFVLLFVIRTIFIGFIQKRKWIGDDDKFVQSFFKEYKDKLFGKNEFYSRWITPLFFEALNSPQGRKVAYRNNNFSKETESKLQMAPFLNGGLFKSKQDYDDNGWIIPDKEIEDFFKFLFAHSFTTEENSLGDEDLQLNPEFLGIIFERLVNKSDGAVYTPRTEVDLMCRLSLTKWLQKNLENPIKIDNLYELFFREGKKEEDQKEGSFSKKEAKEILDKLENLAICDPAAGSGAFLVGIMQVLDQVEQSLKRRYGLNGKNLFERKKQIIKNSLYGVEVKEWAVWVCRLRLWLSLFVDVPDNLKNSFEPILPSLDFKIRRGDSLVQCVGSKTFPISGHNLSLGKSTKDKITKLKNFKLQYFDNKSELKDWELKQRELAIYDEILDVEIKEKGENLKKLKNIKPSKNLSLFGEKEAEQKQLEFDKGKIEKLEIEIKELKEQKRVLRGSGKPLIWNIEFAEVFADKKGFDLIIGNPPYVRQEGIADPMGKIKDKKEYKNFLQEMAKLDFPDDFPPRMKINAQSDLYVYFYIRGLRLLNPNGIHTFICSNSWLDVGYGVWLQNFLLKCCPIEFIIDNHAKRSFSAADVNTIISVIGAPKKKISENHRTKFVAFKKPFEEAIFTENLLAIERAEKVESNDIFRVYPIAVKDLKEAGTEYESDEQKKMKIGKYVGDKWGGKYLRAPDIFFTILEKGKDKLNKLKKYTKILPGCYSGINDFFYLNQSNVNEFKIERKYLTPLIRSAKVVEGLIITKTDKDFVLEIESVGKKELGQGVSNYITWGEKQITRKRQKTEAGIPWPKVESVKNRKYWYSIPKQNLIGANIFMQYVSSDRFYCPYSDKKVTSDRCFHRIFVLDEKNTNNVKLILNSTLQAFFVMLFGRSGLGQGALKFEANDALNILSVSPEKINMSNKKISKILSNLGKRRPLSLFEECGIDPKSKTPIEEQNPKPLPDRAELDKIVFDAIGLSEPERKEVYRAVCRLVWNRISKAKSV